jgi:beta-glucanase (GH16 family)
MSVVRHWLAQFGPLIGAVIALAAAVAVGISLQPDPQAGDHRPGPIVTPGPVGTLVWADDFDGPAGSPPDPAKWGHETGGRGFGNSELEYYTNSTSNAALDGNGDLVITARRENPAGYRCWYGSCQYTSARLNTAGKFTQQYGHIEARIKLPEGQGIWPAFWTLGSNIGKVGWPASGEMDIMETIGTTTDVNHGSLHGPGYSASDSLGDSYTLPGGQSFADGFHTFAVDWAPDLVSFLVDGQTYQSLRPADTGGQPWAFNHPFYLLLNVAVGGTWPGSPNAGTAFPQQMIIDYVHVYAMNAGVQQ